MPTQGSAAAADASGLGTLRAEEWREGMIEDVIDRHPRV
jgi:hypothetical protein